MTLVFDGHNDALGRLWCASSDPVADFARPIGHINVPQAKAGGLGGGLFALFSPQERKPFEFNVFAEDERDIPLSPPLEEGAALVAAIGQAGIAHGLQNAGHLRYSSVFRAAGPAQTESSSTYPALRRCCHGPC